MTRIVIDTNLWISMLLTNRHVKLDALIDRGNMIILYDKRLLEEITEVLLRPEFLKYISRDNIQDILDFITGSCTFIAAFINTQKQP